jgi:hypothetical protein
MAWSFPAVEQQELSLMVLPTASRAQGYMTRRFVTTRFLKYAIR